MSECCFSQGVAQLQLVERTEKFAGVSFGIARIGANRAASIVSHPCPGAVTLTSLDKLSLPVRIRIASVLESKEAILAHGNAESRLPSPYMGRKC
jgi:hypothetical protein